MGLVYLDGRFVEKLDAKVSVFDHGLQFGDGAAIGLRIFDGKLPLLAESVDALMLTASRLSLRFPMGDDHLAAAIRETVRVNERKVGYVRVMITRGAGMLAHDPRKCEPSLVIIADDVLPYPDDVSEHGLEVVVCTSVRRQNFLSDTQYTLSDLVSVLAKREALGRGCLDAIVLDAGQRVTGTVDSGLALVRGGSVVVVPPPGCPDAVFTLWLIDGLHSAGVPVVTRVMTQDDLATADELFLAGTVPGVVPIVKVDGRAVGDGSTGPVTRDIRRRVVQWLHE
jgi:branched-chain amino acid aminotransferase